MKRNQFLDLISPIGRLSTANIVYKALLLKEKAVSPLVETDGSLYRLYLSDMGLFTYQSGLNLKTFVSNKYTLLSGIYFENYLVNIFYYFLFFC